VPYPFVIVSDRYGGTYSGTNWLAFAGGLPGSARAAFGDEIDAAQFWAEARDVPMGRGSSPDAALSDLEAPGDSADGGGPRVEHLYPVTIVEDRYGGTYSGARWLAFLVSASEEIPEGAFGGDVPTAAFWSGAGDRLIGRGRTPNGALDDLRRRLRAGLHGAEG